MKNNLYRIFILDKIRNKPSNHVISSNKMKNIKYHTVGTVLKYHTVGTVPKI